MEIRKRNSKDMFIPTGLGNDTENKVIITGANPTTKDFHITENGVTEITIDEPYNCITGGTIWVETPGFSQDDWDDAYKQGREKGRAEQKARLTTLTATTNGTFEKEDGYKRVVVNIPMDKPYELGYETGYKDGYDTGHYIGDKEGYDRGYGEGYDSGYTAGDYDGYSRGYHEGDEIGYERGYNEGYGSGYTDGDKDGYEKGYSSGYTDGDKDGYDRGYMEGDAAGYERGYDSGYTDGDAVGYARGYEEGDAAGYTRGYADGYASGHTDGDAEGYQRGYGEGYDSGYTKGDADGYERGYGEGDAAGYNRGYEEGYNTGKVDGFNLGYDSGYTDGDKDGYDRGYAKGDEDGFDRGHLEGYTEGYETGHTVGYAEGYDSGMTDGMAEQKALLGRLIVKQNGEYSAADGYGSVKVNVRQHTVYAQAWFRVTEANQKMRLCAKSIHYLDQKSVIMYRINEGEWKDITELKYEYWNRQIASQERWGEVYYYIFPEPGDYKVDFLTKKSSEVDGCQFQWCDAYKFIMPASTIVLNSQYEGFFCGENIEEFEISPNLEVLPQYLIEGIFGPLYEVKIPENVIGITDGAINCHSINKLIFEGRMPAHIEGPSRSWFPMLADTGVIMHKKGYDFSEMLAAINVYEERNWTEEIYEE